MKKLFLLTILIGVLILAGCGASDDTPADNGDDAPVVTDGDGEPVDDGDEGDETTDWQTYHNEEFGFGLTLTEGYKGYSLRDGETSNPEFTSMKFFVDSSNMNWPDDEFAVFNIMVRPINWWEENADVAEAGSEAYLKGVEKSLPNALGIYLGKNNRYSFTWSRGHECPGDLEDPNKETLQCELYMGVGSLMESFKVFYQRIKQ